MHYKIIYEPEAEKALEQISCYYIDQVGYELASNIIETITEAINSLQTMPNRCQKSDFSENVHRLVLPKLPYLVYFCILEISQEVVILEILHGKRDQRFLQTKYEKF